MTQTSRGNPEWKVFFKLLLGKGLGHIPKVCYVSKICADWLPGIFTIFYLQGVESARNPFEKCREWAPMHFHHKQRGLPHRHQQKPTNQPMSNDCVLYGFFYTKSEARSHLKKVSLSYCSWFLLNFDDLWHQFEVEVSSLDFLQPDQDPLKNGGSYLTSCCNFTSHISFYHQSKQHKNIPDKSLNITTDVQCVILPIILSNPKPKSTGHSCDNIPAQRKAASAASFLQVSSKQNGRAHSPLGPADSNRINKLQTCRVKKPICWENVLKLKWGCHSLTPTIFEFSDILSLIIAPNSRLRLPLGSRSHSPRRAPAPAPQRFVSRHWKEVPVPNFDMFTYFDTQPNMNCIRFQWYSHIDHCSLWCDRTWKAHPLKA